jgi:hypothetical protein
MVGFRFFNGLPEVDILQNRITTVNYFLQIELLQKTYASHILT